MRRARPSLRTIAFVALTNTSIFETSVAMRGWRCGPQGGRELNISSSGKFYKWRSKYGDADVSLMARMKELEAESARRLGTEVKVSERELEPTVLGQSSSRRWDEKAMRSRRLIRMLRRLRPSE